MISMGMLRRTSSAPRILYDRVSSGKIVDSLPVTSSRNFRPAITVPGLVSSQTLFPLFPLLSMLRLPGMADGGPKVVPKASVWRKLLVQFGVCFTLGVCLGFLTPYKWPADVPDSLAINGKNFVSDVHEGMKMANALEATGLDAKLREVVKFDEVENGLSGFDAFANIPLEPRKLLIVVTATYSRPFKAYYLTRLAHTLKLIPPPLLWLVVEMHAQSLETAALLSDTGIMYRHLVCDKNLTDIKDRGTHQRNVALAHIEQHQLDGIIYFADDDNVYTLELFEQLRLIRRFGTWPVGMLAPGKSRAIIEGPVCKGEEVIGWHTNEKSKKLRRFHVDMSGFAFNSTILWDPSRWRRPTLEPVRQLDTIKEGFQETTFIEQLVADESQMEGRPPGCSKVMVWHLHLEAPQGYPYPPSWTLTEPLQVNIPLRKDS